METATAELRQGAWVQPVNRSRDASGTVHTTGSIHIDEVARQVGMRGGTIPGTAHLNHFVPLLDELFGDRWLIDGTISMYFTYATAHLEDVRAVITAPPGRCWDEDAIFPAWVETPDGKTVAKGTVSIGSPSTPNYVRSLKLESAPAGANRIVRARPGTEAPVQEFMAAPTEAGIIRDPSRMFGAMTLDKFLDTQVNLPAVAFYGATEIVLRHGPVRTGVPYKRTGKVISVGVSDKTEFVWYDCELTDAEGRVIVETRHLNRWMKALSPLWEA